MYRLNIDYKFMKVYQNNNWLGIGQQTCMICWNFRQNVANGLILSSLYCLQVHPESITYNTVFVEFKAKVQYIAVKANRD